MIGTKLGSGVLAVGGAAGVGGGPCPGRSAELAAWLLGFVWAAGHSPACDGSGRGPGQERAPALGAKCLLGPSSKARPSRVLGVPSQSCFRVRPRKPHSEYISCLRNSHSRFRNFIPKSFGARRQGEAPSAVPRGARWLLAIGPGVGRVGFGSVRSAHRKGERTLNPVILE